MKDRFQTSKVLAVSFSHLIHDVYGSFLAPLLPLLVGKLGITLSMAGLLDSVRNSPSLFNAGFGLLIDRMKLKYFLVATPAITTIVMSLIGMAPSYIVAVIMIFIMGISSSLFHIPAPVIIRMVSADKIGTGMSFYMVAGEISRTLGPLIITGAVSLWGLEGTWRLIPFGLASSIVLAYILRDYRDDETREIHPRQERSKARSSVLIPLLGSIGGYVFFITAMKVALTLYLPAYLMAQGESLVTASLMLSILQFSGAVGTLFAGAISDKIGRKTILLISGVMNPVLMWLFMIGSDSLRIPILAVLGFFQFTYNPIILALLQEADHPSPSFVNGLYMTIVFIVRSSLVFLVGLNIEYIGFEVTYRIAALLAVGAVPAIYFIPDYRKKPAVSHEQDQP